MHYPSTSITFINGLQPLNKFLLIDAIGSMRSPCRCLYRWILHPRTNRSAEKTAAQKNEKWLRKNKEVVKNHFTSIFVASGSAVFIISIRSTLY